MNTNEVLELTPTKRKKPRPSVKESKNLYLFANHLDTYKNPDFEASLSKFIISNNSAVFKHVNPRFIRWFDGLPYLQACNVPKWFTRLQVHEAEAESGELLTTIKETNNLIRQGSKQVKKMLQFDRTYTNLYREKKCTCLMITLTRVSHANHTIISFLSALKKQVARANIDILGYVWAAEVKLSPSKEPFFHYHIILATSRLPQRFPKCLYEQNLRKVWGQIVDVEYIKTTKLDSAYLNANGLTHTLSYACKYISKNDGICLGVRRYGSTRTFKLPE